MTKPRRNDVVFKTNESHIMYGRVNRRIDENHVEVIDCGRYVTVYHIDELTVDNDYTGYIDTYGPLRKRYPVFRRMPTLRQLKQRAAYYNKAVWKRFRTVVDTAS